MGGKRRERSSAKDKANAWVLAAVGVVVVVAWLVRLIAEHPALFGGAGAVLLAAAVVVARVRWSRAREGARRQAERDALISSTDTMSGREFEHWTARLLAVSGCVGVEVVGGSGDAEADVVAYTPTGQRVVAQCKRYATTE